MKAAFHYKYTGPGGILINEVPDLIPGDKELLIKVYACTFNRTDCANISAHPWIMRLFMGLNKPKNPISGTDFAGLVIATGAKVTRFKKGDRVFGFKDSGIRSHAEQLCIDDSMPLESIPDTISFEQAVASIEGAHYALNFINKVPLKKDQLVLVLGGTGAIGSSMIQLLKILGLHIHATCRGEHFEMVTKLGAEEVFDYINTPLSSLKGQYDYVFDCVGKSTFSICKKLLLDKGVYISSEAGPYAQNTYLSLFTKWSNRKVVFPIPFDPQRSLTTIREYLAEGSFDPMIDRSYRLEEINEAYSYVSSGEKLGNVLLNPAT